MKHVARWVLATVLTVSILLAAVSVHVRRSEGGALAPPSSGALLDWDSTLVGTHRTLAVLTDAHLDLVVDVATAGDTAFVLGPRSWRSIVGGRVRGPFGELPVGAPGGLDRARRIVVADSGVYVLDVGRRDVVRFSRTGRVLQRYPIGRTAQVIVPQDLAVGAHGAPIVVAHEMTNGAFRWLVLRLAGDSTVALLRGSDGASLFTQPRIATSADDVLLVDPTTHTRHWLLGNRRAARPHAPTWDTPDSLRSRYGERMAMIGAGSHTQAELPDTLPSLHTVAVTRTGTLLTGTNPLGDDLVVEAFAADGSPLGRLFPEPLRAPVFLTADGIVQVTEEANRIVITLLTLAR